MGTGARGQHYDKAVGLRQGGRGCLVGAKGERCSGDEVAAALHQKYSLKHTRGKLLKMQTEVDEGTVVGREVRRSVSDRYDELSADK